MNDNNQDSSNKKKLLLTEIISKAVKSVFEEKKEEEQLLKEKTSWETKPQTQLFRRSKWHPEERAKAKALKLKKKKTGWFGQNISRNGEFIDASSNLYAPQGDSNIVNALIPILSNIHAIPALRGQVLDPGTKTYKLLPNEAQKAHAIETAESILIGRNVPKKEVVALAKFLYGSRILGAVSYRQITKGLIDIFHQSSM